MAPYSPARMETLPALEARAPEAPVNSSEPVDKNAPPVCTPDGKYCFAFRDNADLGTSVVLTRPQSTGREAPLIEVATRNTEETVSLWPQLVRAPGLGAGGQPDEQLIFGILTREAQMYSGGGGSVTQLRLYRLIFGFTDNPIVSEILSLPLRAHKMIRACFSEQDYEDRRQACHDEYDFAATLSLLPDPSSPDPVFALSVAATSFPRGVTLEEDSTKLAPLKKGDLIKTADRECTYTRTLRFNPPTGRYEFDRPGPDCSEYTVP